MSKEHIAPCSKECSCTASSGKCESTTFKYFMNYMKVTIEILFSAFIYRQGEAHKVLQSDSTQTIDHIQKCFRQKFQ